MFLNTYDPVELFSMMFAGENLDQPYLASGVSLPVRFYKKVGEGMAQEDYKKYPVLVITPQSPQFNSNWYNDVFWNRLSGAPKSVPDLDDPGENKIVVPMFFDEFLMDVLIDVSVAVKSAKQKLIVESHFIQSFGKHVPIWMKQYPTRTETPSEDNAISAPVDTYMIPTEVPRPDGIFQLNFEFRLECWVSSGDPVVLDTLKTLNINPRIVGLES